MSADVVIIDYGIGNLFSVRRAFEKCGAAVEVTCNAEAISGAPRLVLPGVGAFADGMRGLVKRGLDTALRKYAESGKPLLGICLGMQMLTSFSEEFGRHRGLDIIPGRVVSIPNMDSNGRAYKVPHVGWDDLQLIDYPNEWKGTILDDLIPGEAIYLTHSFAVTVDDPAHRLAFCTYNGTEVTTAIRNTNVYGVQFHPEKSGPVGLKILSNFLKTN